MSTRYQVNAADGLRLRDGPGTDYKISARLPHGTVVHLAGEYAWRLVITADGNIGWVADAYLTAVPDESAPADGIASDTTPERVFTLDELLPLFQEGQQKYGPNARVLAAITYQESGFRNWRVHHDGTGHGLIGLDDNGMLPDFEDWLGVSRGTVGRGYDAQVIPVGSQLRYLAFAIGRYGSRYGGDDYAAARAWHRGPGLMDDWRGLNYEQLIRAHIVTLFG